MRPPPAGRGSVRREGEGPPSVHPAGENTTDVILGRPPDDRQRPPGEGRRRTRPRGRFRPAPRHRPRPPGRRGSLRRGRGGTARPGSSRPRSAGTGTARRAIWVRAGREAVAGWTRTLVTWSSTTRSRGDPLGAISMRISGHLPYRSYRATRRTTPSTGRRTHSPRCTTTSTAEVGAVERARGVLDQVSRPGRPRRAPSLNGLSFFVHRPNGWSAEAIR